MNIKDAKNIPLDEFLEHLGQVCAKVSGGRKWYRAPWRDENTPSLVLTKDCFAWYDHGEGRGGSIIELAMRYGDLRDVSDALDFIERAVGCGYNLQPARMEYKPVETELPYYELIRHDNFRIYQGRGMSKGAQYLASRCIDPDTIELYVRDVKFNARNNVKKVYQGIGIQNNSGGFEVRADFGKGHQKISVGQKDLSFFQSTVKGSENGTLHIFEGAPDFWTYLTINSKKSNSINPASQSYLILNGTGMVERALGFLRENFFRHILIWSQYGEGGQKMEDQLVDFFRDSSCVVSITKDSYQPPNDIPAKNLSKWDLNAWFVKSHNNIR